MNYKNLMILILFLSSLSACASFGDRRVYKEMQDELKAFALFKTDLTPRETKQSALKTKKENIHFTKEQKRLENTQKRWAENMYATGPRSAFYESETEETTPIRAIAGTDKIKNTLVKGIDLDTLIPVAVVRNPKLKAALKEWQASLERYTQATQLDNILRQYQSFIKDLNLRNTQMKHKAPIMKHFPLPGTLSLKGDLIDQSVKLARERYDIVLRDLITQIRLSYYALQFNSEGLKITVENRDILVQLEKTVLAKYKTSKSSFSNVIKVQIRIAQLENDLISLRQFRLTLLAKLKQALNLDSEWQLGPAKPSVLRNISVSIQTLFETGKTHQQEIQIARLKIEQTKLAILLGEKMLYPDLTLGFSIFEAGQAALPERMKRIKTPFWFGKGDAYLREARLKYQGLHEKRKALEDKLAYRIEKHHFEFSNAKRDVALYRDSLLQLSKAALDVTETEYRAGTISFLDVLDAEATWLKYKLLYHQSIRNQNQSIARLEQVIGRPLK